MKREAGEARKLTTSAMSSGSPQRPRGVCERIHASRSSACARAVSGVRMSPGATALTRMPRGPRCLGQRAQRRLCRGVDRGRRAGHRQHGDRLDRGDADHGAARRHEVDQTLQQEERGARIDADDPLPVGQADLSERPRLDDARAVDEHVDARGRAAHGLDRLLDGEQIRGHVRARLRSRRWHGVDRHDVEAVARQALGARVPDTAGAPGDDCDGHAVPSSKFETQPCIYWGQARILRA